MTTPPTLIFSTVVGATNSPVRLEGPGVPTKTGKSSPRFGASPTERTFMEGPFNSIVTNAAMSWSKSSPGLLLSPPTSISRTELSSSCKLAMVALAAEPGAPMPSVDISLMITAPNEVMEINLAVTSSLTSMVPRKVPESRASPMSM